VGARGGGSVPGRHRPRAAGRHVRVRLHVPGKLCLLHSLSVRSLTHSQPEFCYGQTTYPGCTSPQPYWYDHFTVHGLWPQYKSGGYNHGNATLTPFADSFLTYSADCTTEAFDPAIVDAIGKSTMTQYWPDVKYAESDPNYTEFWNHEWTKHGTCSGLSQLTYFNSTINLIQSFGTPSVFTSAVGSTISASTLRDAFGGKTYASLQCTSTKYVNGVYTCWDRSTSTGLPTKQIECPSDVQAEDTCTVSTLVVESF
jgi:ribonuclease T2